MWLVMARNIFNRQLTNIPEHYTMRFVFNNRHWTLLLMRQGAVFGGITFRPFLGLDFAEIAFCAIASAEQIRGYGSHAMARLKRYLQGVGIDNILTYAVFLSQLHQTQFCRLLRLYRPQSDFFVKNCELVTIAIFPLPNPETKIVFSFGKRAVNRIHASLEALTKRGNERMPDGNLLHNFIQLFQINTRDSIQKAVKSTSLAGIFVLIQFADSGFDFFGNTADLSVDCTNKLGMLLENMIEG
jgi:hypothetical protein